MALEGLQRPLAGEMVQGLWGCGEEMFAAGESPNAFYGYLGGCGAQGCKAIGQRHPIVPDWGTLNPKIIACQFKPDEVAAYTAIYGFNVQSLDFNDCRQVPREIGDVCHAILHWRTWPVVFSYGASSCCQ